MNNIEILEEFIKYFEAEATQRKYRRNISITVGEDDIEAIENLIQENKELKEKYNRLSHFAIETIFSEFNDDVELLARFLYKEGFINRTKTHYIRKGE